MKSGISNQNLKSFEWNSKLVYSFILSVSRSLYTFTSLPSTLSSPNKVEKFHFLLYSKRRPSLPSRVHTRTPNSFPFPTLTPLLSSIPSRQTTGLTMEWRGLKTRDLIDIKESETTSTIGALRSLSPSFLGLSRVTFLWFRHSVKRSRCSIRGETDTAPGRSSDTSVNEWQKSMRGW